MTAVLSLALSAGALLVAILAAFYARRQAIAAAGQLDLAKQIRREASEPYVIVDISPQAGGTGLLLFSIENTGPTLARDVRLSVTPPLQGGQDASWDERLARVVARPIAFLPPGRRIEWVFGVGFRIFGNASLPHQYTVTVDVTGPSGPVEPLTYLIDLDSINESLMDHNSVEASLMKIADHTRSLRDMAPGLHTIALTARKPSKRARRSKKNLDMSEIPMEPLTAATKPGVERGGATAEPSGAETEQSGDEA